MQCIVDALAGVLVLNVTAGWRFGSVDLYVQQAVFWFAFSCDKHHKQKQSEEKGLF